MSIADAFTLVFILGVAALLVIALVYLIVLITIIALEFRVSRLKDPNEKD